MRFALLTVLAAFFGATYVSALPTGHSSKRSCDILTCVLDLAPTVLSCASAAAAEAVNFIADAGCLVAAAKVVDEFPASCDACADEFGVADEIKSLEGDVSSAVDDIGSELGSIF